MTWDKYTRKACAIVAHDFPKENNREQFRKAIVIEKLLRRHGIDTLINTEKL